MNIIAMGFEIPIAQVISRNDQINGVFRDILELQSDVPFSEEQVSALANDANWRVDHGSGHAVPQPFYTEPVRYSVWMAKTNPTEAQVEALMKEKDALAAERDKLVKALPSLLEGKSEEVISMFQAYLLDVKVTEPVIEEI